MIGLTVVRKAAKKGYKRYGVPGAVVAGVGALVGVRFVRRKLSSGESADSDAKTADSPDDTDSQ